MTSVNTARHVGHVKNHNTSTLQAKERLTEKFRLKTTGNRTAAASFPIRRSDRRNVQNTQTRLPAQIFFVSPR